jgi:hypothetical protein
MSDKKFTAPWIIAALIAIGGVVAPILWDRYNSNNSFELQHLSTTQVIQKDESLNKLKLVYDGQEISDLTIMRFILVNSGRKPILMEHVVSPVTILFEKSANLVDARIDVTHPENIDAKLLLNTNNSMSIEFELLNPEDDIQISAFISGECENYAASARIAGIKELSVINRVQELARPPKKISWTVYPVGFFTFIFLIAWVVSAIEVRKDKKLKKLYIETGASFPRFTTTDEYLEFITTTFSYMTKDERKSIVSFVENLKTSEPLQEPAHLLIEKKMTKRLEGKCASYTICIPSLIIACIGLWYILLQIK